MLSITFSVSLNEQPQGPPETGEQTINNWHQRLSGSPQEMLPHGLLIEPATNVSFINNIINITNYYKFNCIFCVDGIGRFCIVLEDSSFCLSDPWAPKTVFLEHFSPGPPSENNNLSRSNVTARTGCAIAMMPELLQARAPCTQK